MTDPKAYTVGYKRPPEHTRFKKGQSGNPKGRPKGSLNFIQALEKELRSPVTVKEPGGGSRTITKFEAALKQLANKAAMGDHRAMALLMSFVTTYLNSPEGTSPVLAQEADQAVLAGLLKRLEPHAQGATMPTPSNSSTPPTSERDRP